MEKTVIDIADILIVLRKCLDVFSIVISLVGSKLCRVQNGRGKGW